MADGRGWRVHAYPPEPAVQVRSGVAQRRPQRMRALVTAAVWLSFVLSSAHLRADAAALDGALPASFIGAATVAHPVEAGWLGSNPYMSNLGANSMHADGYASDTHPWAGPIGRAPTVTIAYKGPCAGLTFTREGLILLQCGGVTNFTLRLLDPTTLKELASYNLPPRPSTIRAVVNANVDKIYGDSSGAYFYIDNRDRVVVADAAQQIQRIEHRRSANGAWSFHRDDNWDLTKVLPHDCETPKNPKPTGECDPVTSILPDWHGLLWWVTRHGRVGTIEPQSGAIAMITIAGEEIENSHAVSEDGMSVVTDHALYQFVADPRGKPTILWRETYDRGTARKTGQINQGSGTTPTFMGHEYVAITDNADDRMHVNVYKRKASVSGSRLVCSIPVFGHGASASENSLIGWDRAMVVENNYGYRTPIPVYGRTTIAGGLTKVAINEDGRGCHVVWTSAEISPSSVAKLSRGNGLVYCYTPATTAPSIESWYLTALDWRSGRTVYKVKIGTGPIYDNAFGPLTVGPKAVYASIFGGVVRVADS